MNTLKLQKILNYIRENAKEFEVVNSFYVVMLKSKGHAVLWKMNRSMNILIHLKITLFTT